MRQTPGGGLSGQRVYEFAILIGFVKLPSVDIVPTCTLQPFVTRPHHDSLAGTRDLVCGQEGTGHVTAELGPF